MPFVVSLGLVFFVSWKYYAHLATQDYSSGGDTTYFPFVAMTGEGAEIVYMYEWKRFEKEHPECTLLLPEGDLERIDRELERSQERRSGKGTPIVRLISSEPGKQLIEFEIVGDGLFESRYEATERTIRPLSFTLSGPLFVVRPCGVTILVGIIAPTAILGFARLTRRHIVLFL